MKEPGTDNMLNYHIKVRPHIWASDALLRNHVKAVIIIFGRAQQDCGRPFTFTDTLGETSTILR